MPRITINKVKQLLINAHKSGYEPILTINGEFYSIEYNDKPETEAQRVKLEGRY
jgi:hypothetical protein